MKCPKCKSSNYYTGSPVEFDYEGFFTEWHCEDCGHTAPIEEKEE